MKSFPLSQVLSFSEVARRSWERNAFCLLVVRRSSEVLGLIVSSALLEACLLEAGLPATGLLEAGQEAGSFLVGLVFVRIR